MDTLRRFDRIVALLIQLQSARVVKAADLATRFNVSLRTIYRDIRTLEQAGLPITGEAGVGYSLVDGYRLPPVTFTREEAASFIAASKLMSEFTDKSLGDHHRSAIFKIKSVLRGQEKDWIENIEANMMVHPSRYLFNEDIPDTLDILFEGIAARKQVELRYLALGREVPEQRMIEPVGVFRENNYWYVYAYCLKRSDYRQFRTDRLMEIKRSTRDFSRTHLPLDHYRREKKPPACKSVILRVDKNMTRYMGFGKKHFGFISEKDLGDKVEMTFKTADLHHSFPRWLMMFSDACTIIEPESLKERLREIYSESVRRLNSKD